MEVHEDHYGSSSTAFNEASTSEFSAKASDNRPVPVKGVWLRNMKIASDDDQVSDTTSDDPSSKKMLEKNKLKDGLEASLERAPLGDLRKKLLILDINGLLADIQYRIPRGYEADRIAKRAGEG